MKTYKIYISIFFSLLIYFAFPAYANAQAGILDLSFDVDGIVTTTFGSEDEYARAIAIQSDGKIVVAGYSYTGSINVFAVARFHTDGSLDNTFDLDGKVTTAINDSDNKAYAVSIQNDGKIVVAGYYSNGTDNDFAIVRYNTNGSIDSSFDNDGIATIGFELNSNDRAFSLAIQSDGKIVVVGYNSSAVSERDFAIARFNTNGSLDATFNGGAISTPIQIGDDEGHSVIIQDDGKIVVGGFSFDFVTREFTLVRYNTNGSLDLSFDTDGIVTTSISSYDDAAYAIAIQNDGKIIATGYSSGDSYDFALVRYNTDGTLDNTFDSDGIVTTSIGTSATSADLSYAISIQNDGKILVAGHADYDLALARYNTNGSLDNSFDMDGTVTTYIPPIETDDILFSLTIQADGKIVAAGNIDNGSNNDFVVARYHSSGVTSINSISDQNKECTIYPNPFNDVTTIRLNRPIDNVTIKIYNALGQQVKEINNISEQSVILDRKDLTCGFYFIECIEDNNSIATGKLIVIE